MAYQHKKSKAFVSQVDRMLYEFNRSKPKTAAQEAEINKHKTVFAARDNANFKQVSGQTKDDQIWEDF